MRISKYRASINVLHIPNTKTTLTMLLVSHHELTFITSLISRTIKHCFAIVVGWSRNLLWLFFKVFLLKLIHNCTYYMCRSIIHKTNSSPRISMISIRECHTVKKKRPLMDRRCEKPHSTNLLWNTSYNKTCKANANTSHKLDYKTKLYRWTTLDCFTFLRK